MAVVAIVIGKSGLCQKAARRHKAVDRPLRHLAPGNVERAELREKLQLAVGKVVEPGISNKIAGVNGGRGGAASIRRNGKADTVTIKPVLDPDGSAALRDQLLTEINGLSSSDAAAVWAHRIMAAKNSLAAADSRRIEDAFAAKIAILRSGEGEVIIASSSSPETSQPRLPQNPHSAKAGEVGSSFRFQPCRQEPARATGAASTGDRARTILRQGFRDNQWSGVWLSDCR